MHNTETSKHFYFYIYSTLCILKRNYSHISSELMKPLELFSHMYKNGKVRRHKIVNKDNNRGMYAPTYKRYTTAQRERMAEMKGIRSGTIKRRNGIMT